MQGTILLFAMYTGMILRPTPPTPIQEPLPLYEGVASYYDYELEGTDWSVHHSTCAFHGHKKTYQMYTVCNVDNGKCVECYNNDWMRNDERVVDLSSHAFRQIGNTKLGLLSVKIYTNEERP